MRAELRADVLLIPFVLRFFKRGASNPASHYFPTQGPVDFNCIHEYRDNPRRPDRDFSPAETLSDLDMTLMPAERIIKGTRDEISRERERNLEADEGNFTASARLRRRGKEKERGRARCEE